MAEWLWTSGDWEVEGAEVCLEVDEEREGSGGNGRPGTNMRESIDISTLKPNIQCHM